MSFWDTIGKVGQAVGKGLLNQIEQKNKEMERRKEKIERIKIRYQSHSDKDLYNIYKTTSSFEEKMAAAQLLKERGYGSTNQN
jgi:homoserine dehydrogenase